MALADTSSQNRLSYLAAAARERLSERFAGRRRVVVQVGHCSLAAGAADVSIAARGRFVDGEVVIAGCDGACFASPSLLALDAAGGSRRWTRLTAADVNAIDADGCGIAEEPTYDFRMAEDANEFLRAQHRIALDGCGTLDAESIDEYLADGGYEAWARALDAGADDTIERISESKLRGRGGAYFPTGLKWRSARGVRAERRYVIVNCEEGEPGLFKDRHLMEGVPHRVIEGALIAAFAVGAREIIFYINAEANLSTERMSRAIDQARALGLIGEDALSSGFGVSVEIRRGAGGYVCGDETTLLNTVEGDRREPRLKPPFPTESGLWSMPTVINNAETLASVPYILTRGAEAFAAVGDGEDSGTKLISLSGATRRPGLVEVPFGATLRRIVMGIGGGARDGEAIRILGVGGPSSGILPASMLDTPIAPGLLHESGVMLGAGGVIAIDDSMSALDAVRNLARYNARESCGKCAPCREGTPRMAQMLDDISSGEANVGAAEDLASLANLVNAASLCGLGQAAGNPILSGLRFFGDELGSG